MSSMNWSFTDIALALGTDIGSTVGEIPSSSAQRVVIDSRKVEPGDLFVCIRGDRFDAHDFADEVVRAGASALVVDRPLDVTCSQFVVGDTRMALGVLAAAWRAKHSVKVIGVVGSNGKTTTKEMIASICVQSAGADQVLVTQGNFNNEIGVPLTLFGLRGNHELAVVEMGMNHVGEISKLAAMASPDVVVMTNAQREHQEFMQSVFAVAQENGMAFEALKVDGVAIFPHGSEFDSLWRKQAGEKRRCVTFGADGDCEVLMVPNHKMCLRMRGQEAFFNGKFIGAHNLINASAAALAGQVCGVEAQAIVDGLEAFEPVSGRLKVVLASDQLLLIDDTYNANPDSVRAAIDVLEGSAGNRMLVLGDMGEVGDQGAQYHQEVVDYALARGIDYVLLLGDLCASATLPKSSFMHFATLNDLLAELMLKLKNGQYTVLVKGSRFMKMERVIAAVLGEFGSTPGGRSHVA